MTHEEIMSLQYASELLWDYEYHLSEDLMCLKYPITTGEDIINVAKQVEAIIEKYSEEEAK